MTVENEAGWMPFIVQQWDYYYRRFREKKPVPMTKPPSEYAKLLYYDTASFYPPALMMAHGIVGADRLLFGSDDPLIGDDTSIVEGLPLPAVDKAKILGGNAARLFKLRQHA